MSTYRPEGKEIETHPGLPIQPPSAGTAGRPLGASGLSDADLAAALGRHEEWAIRALIESFSTYIYGRAFHIIRDAHMAEEVAQEVLLTMWRKPETFDPSKGSLRSFLMGMTRFKAIDVVEKEQGRRSKEALLVESAAFFETNPADRGVAEGMDLRAALEKLVVTERQAIFLAYYRGLTYRQVAELLEVPEGTIKTRIRHGLIALRTQLREIAQQAG